MAKKFPNLRFKKNHPFRAKGDGNSLKPWKKGNSLVGGFKKKASTKEGELEMWIGLQWDFLNAMSLDIWLVNAKEKGRINPSMKHSSNSRLETSRLAAAKPTYLKVDTRMTLRKMKMMQDYATLLLWQVMMRKHLCWSDIHLNHCKPISWPTYFHY